MMAADVTVTPSFVPEDSSTPRYSVIKLAGPFRATELYNDIVNYIKENVSVKRRRQLMKNYGLCFTGSDAVDVVLERLEQNRTCFTNVITRDKALKLCQLLLSNSVFENVSCNNDEKFEDSCSRLYRFLDDLKKDPVKESVELQMSTEGNDSAGFGDSCNGSVTNNPLIDNKQGQIVQEILEITGAWKRYSTESLKRKLTPARLFGRKSTTVEDLSPNNGEISQAVIDEIWKEAALNKLLLLVELPILDGILSYDASQENNKPTKVQCGFSNPAFKSQESLSTSRTSRLEDVWLERATDCFNYLPNGHQLLDISLSEHNQGSQKLKIFEKLSNHYGKLPEPLWSDKFADLHVALFNLLMQGRNEVVLEALQVSILLLPESLREEIKKMLSYMWIAAKDYSVQLNSKLSNRNEVEATFSTTIIRNKTLAPHQAGHLTMFMSDYYEAIFQCPLDIKSIVDRKIRSLNAGREETVPVTATYCEQVSSEEFKKQQTECTENALVDMMNKILDDTNLSLKDKKQKLKQFQKYHPDLHSKHFGAMV